MLKFIKLYMSNIPLWLFISEIIILILASFMTIVGIQFEGMDPGALYIMMIYFGVPIIFVNRLIRLPYLLPIKRRDINRGLIFISLFLSICLFLITLFISIIIAVRSGENFITMELFSRIIFYSVIGIVMYLLIPIFPKSASFFILGTLVIFLFNETFDFYEKKFEPEFLIIGSILQLGFFVYPIYKLGLRRDIK